MREHKDLFFTIEEYEQRLRNLRTEMDSRGIEVLMSFIPENIYYMTGYQTPGYYAFQCLVVPLEREPFMITRFLEETNVVGLSWIEDRAFYQDYEDPIETTVNALKERGLDDKIIGIEEDAWFLTVKNYSCLKAQLNRAQIKDCSGAIEKLRIIKSPQELEYIRQAAVLAEIGMKAAIDAAKVGATENDISAAVHYEMIRAGCEYPSIAPFITSGYRSGLAHSTWSGRKLEEGDLIYLEISGCVKRYSAALMRTVYLGEPPKEIVETADAIIAGLNKAIETIKPGITSGEADSACRDIITEAGWGEHYRHRLGYSIGISFPPDWGEGHIVSLRTKDPTMLQPGMVFHMPPGILVVGKMGIGFSETILVTDNGCEVLTNFERKLSIVR